MFDDLFGFFKCPTTDINIYKNPNKKIIVFLLGFLICVCGLILFGIANSIVIKYINQDFGNLDRLSYELNFKSMLKVIFLSPLLEELAFRLFLKPEKKYYIFISFFIICFYLKSFFDFNFYFLLIFWTLLIIVLFFQVQKITSAINNYFVLFFYGSALFFALLHLKGFNSLNEIQSILFPILLLPYFFMLFLFHMLG